jgi:hypothetical protein
MPIHDNKGRNPVPELGDTSGYYPDGKPPEPTQAEIDAFKAAMAEEISSKVAVVEKDGNEARKRVLREMARKLQRVESFHGFDIKEKKVDGVRGGESVPAIHIDHPILPVSVKAVGEIDGLTETRKKTTPGEVPVGHSFFAPANSKIKPFFRKSETDARIPEGNPYAFPVAPLSRAVDLPESKPAVPAVHGKAVIFTDGIGGKPVVRSAESAPLDLPVSKDGQVFFAGFEPPTLEKFPEHPVTAFAAQIESPIEHALVAGIPETERPESHIHLKPIDQFVIRAEGGTESHGAGHHERTPLLREGEGGGDGVDFRIDKADRKHAVDFEADKSGNVPEAVMQAGALYRLHTGEDPLQAAFHHQAQVQHGHTTPLTQEVVSMVDRLLVTADSGSYVKEVRMSMNDSVLPNVEIQFRQVGNSLTVILINEGGESLEMLRKEAPELAEALRSRTGDEVEVKIITGVGAGASEETV